jgi:hypothetical protein
MFTKILIESIATNRILDHVADLGASASGTARALQLSAIRGLIANERSLNLCRFGHLGSFLARWRRALAKQLTYATCWTALHHPSAEEPRCNAMSAPKKSLFSQ